MALAKDDVRSRRRLVVNKAEACLLLLHVLFVAFSLRLTTIGSRSMRC